MDGNDHQPFVLSLADPVAGLQRVGGKGASMARLARAELPVPGGFHVTTDAYTRFVEEARLQEPILAAATEVRVDDPATFQVAEDRIRALFASAALPEAIVAETRRAYGGLDGEPAAVAVRSSATAEDLPDLSFAGQQDTFLNICGETALLDAVRACWASLWTARAIGYRARNGIAPEHVRLAILVQELVPADAAGVLFTVDPTTGTCERMVINAAWGLGEAVVGGQVTPDTVIVDRAGGTVIEQRIGRKTVMTVREADGTREAPVPAGLQDRAVLQPGQAEELARLGTRIEELYGAPMDIEWARHEDRLYVLQARPITTLPTAAVPPEREEWNDSRSGDFLWTRGNIGEAIPSVMTPATWSLLRPLLYLAMASQAALPGVHPIGNIGGRLYINLSALTPLGDSKLNRTLIAQAVGDLPADMAIPPLPFSTPRALWYFLRSSVRARRRYRSFSQHFHAKLAEAPGRCQRARANITAAQSTTALERLWHTDVDPTLQFAAGVASASRYQGGTILVTFRRWLRKHGVTDSDINALATAATGTDDDNPMASLGPIVGLAQLARGEIDRDTFASRWGHRGPDEFELSVPRPAEDLDWVDRQAANMREARTDVDSLLERQKEARDDAAARFAERHPRKVDQLRRKMTRSAAAFRAREAGRSEIVRAMWMVRDFIVRAGEIIGHGDDLFFLKIDEILAVLRGDDAPLTNVPVRRTTYEHYRRLPGYPTLIRGRFDPDRWTADPNRRTDIFDEHHDLAPVGDAIRGAPGAAGIVEGTARVVDSAAEGEALRTGEILVTTVTNVGWTPLFPRAAAVVTDVGAVLSHAAIVARELGIPAVVGTGNATTHLRTGDHIRVDGGHGTVEILATADRGNVQAIARNG